MRTREARQANRAAGLAAHVWARYLCETSVFLIGRAEMTCGQSRALHDRARELRETARRSAEERT